MEFSLEINCLVNLPAMAITMQDPGRGRKSCKWVSSGPFHQLPPYRCPLALFTQHDVAFKCASGYFKKIMLVHPGNSSPPFGFVLFCNIKQ